jgi:hypothetical protein
VGRGLGTLLVAAALVLAPAALSAGGSISVPGTTVAVGSAFQVNVCTGTAGDGGYLVIKGPNTFIQDVFFGPISGCANVDVSTVGWVPGKYRIAGYEFTPKRDLGLGNLTVTAG